MSPIVMKRLGSEICETEKTVIQRILEHAHERPNDIAIIAKDKETTYKELAEKILSIHDWLKSCGVLQGDCVAVQAIHEDICIACFYAVHLAGAILVPLEKNIPRERVREIADETGAVLIIGDFQENVLSDRWINYNNSNLHSHSADHSLCSDITYPDIDSPCEMIFTTGTTGKSKGVLMTHRSISWYAYSIAQCVEMKEGNRFLITTPLNHAGGLRRTHLSLANGCCVVYLDGLVNLARYFRYIRKYDVTSLYLPPVAIRILLSKTGDKLAEFKDQIDFVYSSSSALPVGDCEKLARLLPNTRLYNAYEASETPGVSAYDYNEGKVLKDCMGIANAGVKLGILTRDGTIRSDGEEEGQICVKSKMNMLEYYREPELTASVWRNEWFVSNDLGYMDAQGRVYYRGRKGDVINIGGYKIAPTDVEEVALLSGFVDECVCIEACNSSGIPFLKLLVVPNEAKPFVAIDLVRFLADRLEGYKVPQEIETTNRIAKTFNGKIDRKAYRIQKDCLDSGMGRNS